MIGAMEKSKLNIFSQVKMILEEEVQKILIPGLPFVDLNGFIQMNERRKEENRKEAEKDLDSGREFK